MGARLRAVEAAQAAQAAPARLRPQRLHARHARRGLARARRQLYRMAQPHDHVALPLGLGLWYPTLPYLP